MSHAVSRRKVASTGGVDFEWKYVNELRVHVAREVQIPPRVHREEALIASLRRESADELEDVVEDRGHPRRREARCDADGTVGTAASFD